MKKPALSTSLALALLTLLPGMARAEVREFRAVAVEMGGTKFWLPATFVVHQGDTVKIKAVSKITTPGSTDHGFAIPGYGIEKVIGAEEQTIEFKADKAGIFPMHCQLHPAHVGGELVVMKK